MDTQDNNKDAIESGKPGRSLATLFLVISVLVGGLYISAYMWGRGGRGYFSPDTLETKTQSEWLIPLTEIPIYRSSFKYFTNDLAQFLLDEGHWTLTAKENPNWIHDFRWNHQWRDGYSMLHRQLSGRGNEWIAWTKSNPKLARVIWPRILTLLRGNANDRQNASALLDYAKYAADIEELRLFLEHENIEIDF